LSLGRFNNHLIFAQKNKKVLKRNIMKNIAINEIKNNKEIKKGTKAW